MNIPNRITLSRLALSGVLFAVLALMEHGVARSSGTWAWIALALFVVATGTDWLDGHLARKYGQVSALGRVLDPFVDKVVVCGTFVFLSVLFPKFVPGWFTATILAREFLIHALRGYMESTGTDFSARGCGKLKMVLQCFSIGGVIILMGTENPALQGPAYPWKGGLAAATASTLLWLALISTLWSGWQYIQAGMHSLKGAGR